MDNPIGSGTVRTRQFQRLESLPVDLRYLSKDANMVTTSTSIAQEFYNIAYPQIAISRFVMPKVWAGVLIRRIVGGIGNYAFEDDLFVHALIMHAQQISVNLLLAGVFQFFHYFRILFDDLNVLAYDRGRID